MADEKENNRNDSDRKPTMVEAFLRYLSRTSPKLMFLHLIWIIVASMALSSSYIVAFHFTSLVAIYNETTVRSNVYGGTQITSRQRDDMDIVLVELMRETSGDRVSMIKYHNHADVTRGIPFLSQTAVHEVITTGINRLMAMQLNIPVHMTPLLNAAMLQNRCLWMNNTDLNPELSSYWYFATLGAKSVIRCPVYKTNGDIIGYVAVDWIENVPNPAMWELVTRNAAARISVILGK